MKLYTLETGKFKLDGGAMFGVVPKVVWSKSHPADENNLCTWSLRCLLIEQGEQLILVDTGMGEKQDEKFFGHYKLHDTRSLEDCLKEHGFSPADVTDVILTHLHFDHCGGAVVRNNSTGLLEPRFKKARYWSNEAHWQWATKPNAREKASFLKENIMPIEESGQLNFLPNTEWRLQEAFPNIDLIFVNGHTEAQMLPIVKYKGQEIAFCADLLPSVHHLPLAWVMGYDMRPLLTLTEKERFLSESLSNGTLLMYQHDAHNQMSTLTQSERGIRAGEILSLSDLL